MARGQPYDAHERPPKAFRDVFKLYSKKESGALDLDPAILDFRRGMTGDQQSALLQTNSISRDHLLALCNQFHAIDSLNDQRAFTNNSDFPIYEARDIPGLRILPALFPPSTQRCLLSRLLHRDLANERHMTNIHAHYDVPYAVAASEEIEGHTVKPRHQSERLSFFSYPPTSSVSFQPLDSNVHKPLTISQVLRKKLRWMTLGGQYDWTNKIYPSEVPPPFPRDLANLLHGVFPEMVPQAAIVNIYSPGDTLSIHRDVSEDCDNGLISVSLGCDGIFVIGLEASQLSGENQPGRYLYPFRVTIVRLRSGDVVYMSGKARYAWHGVPKIVANTCPTWLQTWPAAQFADPMQESDTDQYMYEGWRGWAADKRINLNVRQMHE
ncbi:MAG: hypothetical protein M1836_008158 [Candelina mexicana]|nr:MAG: hypothetical protein M1836_008158 [Candelina mexicana]